MKMFSIIPNTFSKKNTTYFKGIAILMIIIHNYLHLIPGFSIENEFSFSAGSFFQFLDKIKEGSAHGIIGGFFSFLGHFGVQLFFFFSAYGLTIQYPKWKGTDFQFILHRLKKVYFLLAFGFIFCIIYYYFLGIAPDFLGTMVRAIILGSTLSSFTSILILSGPFWFFAAIIQFYILFPFLYRFITKFDLKKAYLPVLISLAIIYFLYFSVDQYPITFQTETFHLSLFTNVIGHLPELILGIIMAHFRFKSFHPLIVLGSLLIFVGSQLTEWLFPLSFLAVTVLLLSIISSLEKYTNAYFKETILFIGKISMILFVVNGPFRAGSLFEVDPALKFERTFLYLFLLFVLSYFFYLFYDFLVRKLKI